MGEETEIHLGRMEAETSVGPAGVGGRDQEAVEGLGSSELPGKLASLGRLNQRPVGSPISPPRAGFPEEELSPATRSL